MNNNTATMNLNGFIPTIYTNTIISPNTQTLTIPSGTYITSDTVPIYGTTFIGTTDNVYSIQQDPPLQPLETIPLASPTLDDKPPFEGVKAPEEKKDLYAGIDLKLVDKSDPVKSDPVKSDPVPGISLPNDREVLAKPLAQLEVLDISGLKDGYQQQAIQEDGYAPTMLSKQAPKEGQRWMFENYDCKSIVEILFVGSQPQEVWARTLQVIKCRDVTKPGPFGTKWQRNTFLLSDFMNTVFWTYLEGQDSPYTRC